MEERRWQGGMLRLFRTLRGLDAREVAEALGVGAWMVSRWESGQAKPDWEQLRALAQLYGVSVETLMDAMDYEGTTIAAGLRDSYRAMPDASQQNSTPPFGRTLRRSRATQDSSAQEPRTRGCSPVSALVAAQRSSRTSVLYHKQPHSTV